VYNTLTEAIKKRIILELRRFWSYDPNYRDELVKNIQGKYSFRSRPCMSIIVKNSSANVVQLSADNFQGTVSSYVYLQKVQNYPGLSLEWVREDGRAIQANGGVFPTEPGVYYIAVEQEEVIIGDTPEERLVFYVDPLLRVTDETPIPVSPLQWQLKNGAFHAGSLVLYELPGNLKLYEDANYTVNASTGLITLVSPLPSGTWLSADYRYPGTSTGPWLILENHTQVKALPGVILAFGRRVEGGDRLSVIVEDRRQPVALEYGGRWEISLDLDVMAMDVEQQMEICDKTTLYLWGIARNRLSYEGIEITQVSFGGETEEIRDETGDDYFYGGSISVTLMSDWAIHVPLDPFISRVSPQTVPQAAAAAAMTPEELATDEESNLQAVEDANLITTRDPFFVGRGHTYEVIK